MITYWNLTDISDHTGVDVNALRQRRARGSLPAPDAMLGVEYGFPGWLPENIKRWWAGKGADDQAADEMLTTDEAAALLGKSSRTLTMWRGAGQGPPFVKFGNRVRYAKPAVDAWLEGGQGA